MNDVDVYKKFPELFHYTTMSGLEGILTSQSLHATHIAHLNDREETRVIRPKLRKHIEPLMTSIYERIAKEKPDHTKAIIERFGSKERAISHETHVFEETLYKVTYEHYSDDAVCVDPYVVSFCAHKKNYEKRNGLLSQWRAYGKNIGAAIVFDAHALWELMLAESEKFIYEPFFLAEVSYADENFCLENDFPDFVVGLNEIVPKLFFSADVSIASLFIPYLRASCTLKHQGFSEENEIRAIFAPLTQRTWDAHKEDGANLAEEYKNKGIKEVLKKSGFVPYLNLFDSAEHVLPIKRIVIGPGRNSGMWLPRIQRAVRGSKIEVYCSDTPLI
jgi:Protein of unknown function (DUF2971)